MTVFQETDLDRIYDSEYAAESWDEELWEAACREADRRDDIYTTPEDILREWDAADSYDGYDKNSTDLYDRIAFDCD